MNIGDRVRVQQELQTQEGAEGVPGNLDREAQGDRIDGELAIQLKWNT